MKRCPQCELILEDSAFNKSSSHKDGLQSHCKSCRNALVQKHRRENRVEHREKSRQYDRDNSEHLRAKRIVRDALNKERIKLKNAEWYQKNKGRSAESARAWREANRDQHAATSALWASRNRARCREKIARYNAARRRATPAWVDHKQISEIYFAADFLGMVTGEWHHVDHIVPLQSKLVCGLHWHANLQVLLGVDNRVKSNRRWPDMP